MAHPKRTPAETPQVQGVIKAAAPKNTIKKPVGMGEETQITKEDVVTYLVDEGYANNEVSAEILHQHVSDEFLASIEEDLLGKN